MLMQWIQKVMIVSLALAVKAGSGIQYEKVLGDSKFISFSSCSSDWLFTNNTVTGVQATSVTGVSVSNGDLCINNAHGYHEGLYTCSNDPNAATNVTVYAAPKFHGCSTTNCNLGTTVTVPEGQSTLLNISLDYVNGGPSGAKQSMQAVILKRNGVSGSLLYCNTGTPDCSIKRSFIQNYTQTTTASNHTFSLRTSNVAISDSGIYVAKVELNGIYSKNKITVITSSFTISVTTTMASSSSTLPKSNTFSSVATSTSLEPPYSSLSSFPTSPFQTSSQPPLLGLASPSNFASPFDLASPSASFSGFASSSSSQSPSSSPFIRKLTLQGNFLIIIVILIVQTILLLLAIFAYLLVCMCYLRKRKIFMQNYRDRKRDNPISRRVKQCSYHL